MLTNQLGRPVSGDDFFDRVDALRSIWRVLGDGNNILLLAPRRVGKTSLMGRLKDQARQYGFQPIFVSVADITSEVAFIRRLYAAVQQLPEGKELMRQISKGSVARYLKRIRKVGIATGTVEISDDADNNWTELGDALTAALGKFDTPWLLLIDELPIFVLSLVQQDSTMSRTRHFMGWLRELRVGPHAATSVRWFLAGSIGLDTVTRRSRVGDTINDLHLITNFGPFDEETADAFLDELDRSYRLGLTAEIKQYMRRRVSWLIPYHLQVLFSELRTYCGDKHVPASTAAVDQAYETLLSPAKRNTFDFWEQRLARELGSPEDKQAMLLVGAAAREELGVTRTTMSQVLAAVISDLEVRDQQLHFLLDVLQSDGYLVSDGERFRFRSSLLRQFWLRRVIGG